MDDRTDHPGHDGGPDTDDLGPWLWSTDLNRLCQRIADRLARDGAAHPLVGAVALAVRGHHGVPTDEFAARLGLAPEVLAAVEAGHVPPQELPRPLIDGARFLPGLDLTRLGLT